MRTIKFRAWDKSSKSMVNNYVNGVNRHGELEVAQFSDSELGISLELMQSTGLKDKNGVDIFEGDIVESRFFDKSIVSFMNGCFYFADLPANQWDTYCGEVDCEWSIVGNIHQNPELMEGDK